MIPHDPGPNPQATAMLQRAVELDPTVRGRVAFAVSPVLTWRDTSEAATLPVLDLALAAGERALALASG